MAQNRPCPAPASRGVVRARTPDDFSVSSRPCSEGSAERGHLPPGKDSDGCEIGLGYSSIDAACRQAWRELAPRASTTRRAAVFHVAESAS